LWIVATASLLVATITASAIYIWGTPIEYRFWTISINDQATPANHELVESVKKEATTKTFVGDVENALLINLEALAQRGAVWQVGFVWLEPNGWSNDEHGELDVLNGHEIRGSEVIRRVSLHVHRARLRHAAVYVAAVIPICVAALLLGIAVAWIKRGFSTTT
jgi:hypothetical protein